jgi:hypothetical protein
MKSILIITGAGASHDVVHKNAERDTERPPLTEKLFDKDYILKLEGIDSPCAISHYLKANPLAAHVGYEYMRQPEGKKKTLEKYLFDLFHHKNDDMQCQYWAVPIYLQDLFFSISEYYLDTGSAGVPYNYKTLIDRISVSKKFDQVLWFNLNYDLFADRALRKADKSENMLSNLDHYMRLETKGGLKIKYTKPHGSVNWFYQVKNDYNVNTLRLNGFPVNFQQSIDDKLCIIENLRKMDKARWYPAISAPVGNYKYIYQPHIDDMEKLFYTVESIMCIGFSALDKDIVDLIKKVPNIQSKLQDKTIVVNGKEDDSYRAYELLTKANCAIPGAQASFNGGFSDFLKDHISEWIARQ